MSSLWFTDCKYCHCEDCVSVTYNLGTRCNEYYCTNCGQSWEECSEETEELEDEDSSIK